MPIQDRTNEFRACVESIRNRSSLPQRGSDSKQRLVQSDGKVGSKSEFSRMAAAIGKDINGTTVKLGKLAQRESSVPFLCAEEHNSCWV
jgi:syntaxin 5